jgi:CheY-like chemotaxis protein
MDGHALAARIRDVLGAASPVSVALTGYGEDCAEASRAAGFRAHLVKACVAASQARARSHATSPARRSLAVDGHTGTGTSSMPQPV